MSFVAPNLVYAVDEYGSTMRTFTVDLASGAISTGIQAASSSGVVHLEFNKDHTRMVGAGYGSGKIEVWNVENGGLKLIKTLVSDDHVGPNPSRQSSAHPHQSNLDPSGRFFVVNDLGTDKLLVIDSQKDSFNIVNHFSVTPAGAGPRHGAFYPTGSSKATHYILACEIMNLVQVYEVTYTATGLDFKQIQSVPSFGTYPPANGSTGAAGELVLRGDDVYVSNRLTGRATDNIAHFAITKDSGGKVTGVKYLDQVSSGGKLPRMFSLGSDQKTLFVGNQDGTNGVAVFGIEDGGKMSQPKATLTLGTFGSQPTNGPQFIQQIA